MEVFGRLTVINKFTKIEEVMQSVCVVVEIKQL